MFKFLIVLIIVVLILPFIKNEVDAEDKMQTDDNLLQ